MTSDDMMPGWTELQRRWEEERARAAAGRKTVRAGLLTALRTLGVAVLEIAYDGYADSGNTGEIVTTPADSDIGALAARLGDFAWDVAHSLHPGFEINDGGEGRVIWDVEADRITLDHTDFYTGRDAHRHEDVE